MTDEKNTGNQSLIRGLKLLDLLSNYPNGCPLAMLADLAQLNKSTTHRLLQGLQQEGFVQPTATAGSYRLTTKCLSIGHKMFASFNIVNLAMPYLEQLNLQTGETVNFSVREDDHAVMIYKLEPTTGMLQTRAHIGQSMPLYCSGMGKLYLAYASPDYLACYWARNQHEIQPLTEHTIVTKADMQTELAEIRRQGFARDKEENELGVSCIAFPIFNYKGEVNYALSVSASVNRFAQSDETELLTQIKQVADAISQELGWNA